MSVELASILYLILLVAAAGGMAWFLIKRASSQG